MPEDPESGYVGSAVSLIVLGTVQDAGSPHIACKRECCRNLFLEPEKDRMVVSLGLIDHTHNKKFLIDASPDLPVQMKILNSYASFSEIETPDGILLTHAHIGHYSGLMYLGREGMNSDSIPVHAMPRMKTFLEENGPWEQLVANNNILLTELSDGKTIELTPHLTATPFVVPHRDEYSETVGYVIKGPNRTVLFIPDIDKWQKWDKDIISAISEVDIAFIDGTFYDYNEVPGRDLSKIPHPFIIESMTHFKDLSSEEKKKVHFIHLNHTNPALKKESDQVQKILENGFNIARTLDMIDL